MSHGINFGLNVSAIAIVPIETMDASPADAAHAHAKAIELKAARAAARVTVDRAAEVLGITAKTYRGLENGRAAYVDHDQWDRSIAALTATPTA